MSEELARRALKWMMEHKVYYDPRHRTLLEPTSMVGRRPLAQPADDIALYLFEVVLEVDLEAEHAS
jgi:hypothetical protein